MSYHVCAMIKDAGSNTHLNQNKCGRVLNCATKLSSFFIRHIAMFHYEPVKNWDDRNRNMTRSGNIVPHDLHCPRKHCPLLLNVLNRITVAVVAGYL